MLEQDYDFPDLDFPDFSIGSETHYSEDVLRDLRLIGITSADINRSLYYAYTDLKRTRRSVRPLLTIRRTPKFKPRPGQRFVKITI